LQLLIAQKIIPISLISGDQIFLSAFELLKNGKII